MPEVRTARIGKKYKETRKPYVPGEWMIKKTNEAGPGTYNTTRAID